MCKEERDERKEAGKAVRHRRIMSVQLAAGRDPLLCGPRSMMRMVCIAAASRIGWPVEERIALGVIS